MTDFYQQLIQDHITFTKVLDALDKSVSHFREDSENEPNLPLILDTLEYIKIYPEKFHHPLEEQAFNYLLKNGIGNKKVIAEIQAQHKTLEQETAHLCQQFNAIANDHVVSMEKLQEKIKHYINSQRHHLLTENKKIFPTLAKLNDQAWWDIASGMIIHGDPIFGNNPERQSFKALAAAVIQEQQESEDHT